MRLVVMKMEALWVSASLVCYALIYWSAIVTVVLMLATITTTVLVINSAYKSIEVHINLDVQ